MPKNMRVTDPVTKIGIVLAWLIGTGLVALLVAMLRTSVAAEIVAGVGLVTLIVFTARVFRTTGESKERPWWQLTSRPAASFVIGAWFAVAVIVALVTGTVVSAIGTGLQAIIAVAYLASGVGQSAGAHQSRDREA